MNVECRSDQTRVRHKEMVTALTSVREVQGDSLSSDSETITAFAASIPAAMTLPEALHDFALDQSPVGMRSPIEYPLLSLIGIDLFGDQ